jgi:hypothetical protein
MGSIYKYAHIDWKALRDLITQGATLREISKVYNIPYQTLACRSYRERWNVAAMQKNLSFPRGRSKNQKDLINQAAQHPVDHLPTLYREIRSNFGSVLLRLSQFYYQAPIDTLRKDSRQILQNIYAASKLLADNEARSANQQFPTVNLQLLTVKPQALQFAASVDVPIETAPKTESASASPEQPSPGTPNTSPQLPPASVAQ